MPQNALRILQTVSSSATSGAERHVLHLATYLTKHGHQVDVVCPTSDLFAEQVAGLGVPVHPRYMRKSGYWQTARFMLRLVRERQIDVVHCHLTRATYLGCVVGALAKVPVVATVHVANHDAIYRLMARGRNRLIAVSSFVRGVLHGRGVPDQFIDVVYNGTDFHHMPVGDRAAILEDLGIPPEKRLVGLVGRVCRDKGHLLAVEATKAIQQSHRDAHMLFVGRIEPEFEPELREAIRSFGAADLITLTGNRSDVSQLIDACDLTLIPSSMETFGLVAIEAMARSRPVVASRVGGLAEVVLHQETGLLIDRTPTALAGAVDHLLADHDQRLTMGRSARRWVEEKFTMGQMIGNLQRVYRKAAAPGG